MVLAGTVKLIYLTIKITLRVFMNAMGLRFTFNCLVLPFYLSLSLFMASYTHAATVCKKWVYGTETEIGYVVEYNNQFFRAKSDNNAYRDPMSFNSWWENVGSSCLEPILVSSSSMSSSSISSSSSQGATSPITKPDSIASFTDEQGNIWNDFSNSPLIWQDELKNWVRSPKTGEQCGLGNGMSKWPLEDGTTQTIHSCIHPDSLNGKTIVVPKNVTHISKDAFTICNVTETASFEKNETVIIYVYDHSGSMNVSDPNRDGIVAFKQIMETQQAKAPGSHAGYVAYGSDVRDVVKPSAIDNAQLTVLQSAIKDDFTTNPANGTNTSGALKKAQELLDAPQYANWKKGIIFFSDGSPGTGEFLNVPITGPSGTVWSDSPRCYDCFLIDNAFKGVYSNIYGMMLSGLGAQLFMSDLAVASGGYSVPIANVKELGGLMENILSAIISQKPPQTIQVSNHTLRVQGNTNGLDSTKVITQIDSSRHMILDLDIPLQAGLNEISITTNYAKTGNESVTFYLDVSGEVGTDSLKIEKTSFEISCAEVSTLNLMENQISIDIVAPYVKSPYFAFWTSRTDLGDSIQVRVFSAVAGDEETITLHKIAQTQGMANYRGDFQFTWNEGNKVVSNDGKWEIAFEDSLFSIWINPLNERESIRGKAYAFGTPPPVNKVSFYDNDHDGKLDSLHIDFDDALTEEQLSKLGWVLKWPKFDGTLIEIPMAQGALDERLSQTLGWSFDDEELAILTWVPDTLGPVFSYPLPTYLAETGYSRLYLRSDLMGPVIKNANLSFQSNLEVLTIVFSEPINVNSVPQDKPWLDFIEKDGKVKSHNLSDQGIWNQTGTEFKYMFIRNHKDYYSFDPRNQVKISIPPSGLSDIQDNKAGKNNPYVFISGQYKPEMFTSSISHVDLNVDQQAPYIAVYNYDASLDMKRIIQENNLTGISFGPLNIDETDERKPEDIQWRWSFQVFSTIGQFVNEDSGVISCTDPMFQNENANNCKEHPGRTVFFNWNHRSHQGRLVGSGAYIIKLRINDVKATRTIGVQRVSQ